MKSTFRFLERNIHRMVTLTKNGRIKWSKEEQDSLLIFYKENSDPSLSERAKVAQQLGVPVKKVSNWFNHQRSKMKRKFKVPNFLKKKPKTKVKVERIANVEESHIKEADVDFKEAVAENPRIIKLRKYSKEKATKREVFRIIQPKFKQDRPKPSIEAPSTFKSNTDIHFLDSRASTNELLSEQQLHDTIDRFVNADFSNSENEEFNEDPTLLDGINLTDKSLDVSFFESGQLNNAIIEAKQPVDYGNIQSLISCTSPPPLNMTLNTFLTDFNSDLQKSAEVEDILDLHVQLIADSDPEDEELNAYNPLY